MCTLKKSYIKGCHEYLHNKYALYILFYDNKAITCLYMEPYIFDKV